jgi:hypothetical protein
LLPGPSALKDKDVQVNKDVQMNSNSGSCQGNARAWRAAAVVGALAVAALLAAACGGGALIDTSSRQSQAAQLIYEAPTCKE